MPLALSSTLTLSNNTKIPMLGLGTWKSKEGPEVEQSIRWALDIGYRHIDTAAAYGNEAGVGRAIRESRIPRQEIFLTTKLWNDDIRQGYDACLKAFDASLGELQLDFVDLYLIHWPVKGMYKEAWRAMETIYATGRAKAIGVSNFLVHHLQDLLPSTKVKPMVNQIEFHPHLMQKPLMDFCKKHNILQEAWAPLMRGKLESLDSVTQIAKAKGKTPAQIVLRWDLQHGVVTIPKSVHRERLTENASLYDFELSADEMAQIDALDENRRIGPDPDNFNF